MNISTSPAEFFSWGQRIACDLYGPPDDASGAPLPGVVLCNGLRGVKEWVLPAFAEIFAANGYKALVFDHRGFGASEGVPGRLIPQEQVEDIRNAITFLAGQPDVDAERIVLWGTSFGAANAISVGAAEDQVAAIVAQVPFGDWGRVMKQTLPAEGFAALVAEYTEDRAERVTSGKSRRISPDRMLDNEESRAAKAAAPVASAGERPPLTFPLEAVERCFEYCPERVVAGVAPTPLLIIGSVHDGVIPFSECESLSENAREPKQLKSVEFGHYEIYASPGREVAAQLALDFLRPIIFPG
jgi:fermentation-respiration switch protein FrsA (DUF1100 family)